MTSRYIVGDVFDGLRTLEDDSVDLIVSSPPFLALRSYLPADHELKSKEIGSEATPAAFLDVLLDVVEECARVLAPHGSLCFELGDTYSGTNAADGSNGAMSEGKTPQASSGEIMRPFRRPGLDGWPDAKSLCMIPQSFAWALSYGRNPFNGRETPRWKVRNIVRWCRPNPPVGALGDKFRPGTSEMVVACKSGRRWFDLDAVRTECTTPDTRADVPYPRQMRGRLGTDGENGPSANANNPAGAPPLDWWEIPTQPYAGSHYATWPEKLLVRPILSMCPERVCTVCGEPSRRITATTEEYEAVKNGRGGFDMVSRRGNDAHLPAELRSNGRGGPTRQVDTVGWSDCGHDAWRRGIVLDCFGGSGTTAAVAEGHGRDSILVDIDRRNAELAAGRCGMFLTVEDADVAVEEAG
jgi:site-specific DNA-methyltransferase (adenine-specific)